MQRKPAPRSVRIACIQTGPASVNKELNIKSNLRLVDEAAKEKPDFIVLPELSTTPYFGVVKNKEYFKWAESIPGPTTQAFSQKARQYECHIILPIFEKGSQATYYNSLVVLGPDGDLIKGNLPNGDRVHSYRKCHIPSMNFLNIDEKFYFSGGPGFCIFDTAKATIGTLICYDRDFPEAWRELALRGSEIVFLCTNIPDYFVGKTTRAEQFIGEMEFRARESLFFVVTCNKAGVENLEGVKNSFIGRSCIIGPQGDLLKQAPGQPSIIAAKVDLSEVEKTRSKLPYYLDRRPEIYKSITSVQMS